MLFVFVSIIGSIFHLIFLIVLGDSIYCIGGLDWDVMKNIRLFS